MALKDFSKEKFDIIIQAGQSNSDGTAHGLVDAPYQPKYEVWHMIGDYTIELAREMVVGNYIRSHYALSFADEYIRAGKLEKGRKILILRTSVGGTGFLDKRWGMTDDLYLRMMEMTRTALALNPENRLVGFLWHQGETDAILHATYDGHYKNLTTLLNSVRETFGVPDLPFIAGDFVYHWRDANAQICEPVLRAIRDVCKDAAPAAFVETDGLISNAQDDPNPGHGSDTIHFCRKAIYELGRRYYAAWSELTK
ncbi:MAG: hypothetical protein IJC71_08155 [Clostridia bacterium]|nr:hypothetical protein [Clostridia bacterium]